MESQHPINQAAFAHRQAKSRGSTDIQTYDDTLHERHSRRRALAKEMRRGLEKREFFLTYQPLVNHATRKLFGLKSLLGWNSEKYGPVAPCEFISIAEENGLIVELGDWAMEKACCFWAEENLSRKELMLCMDVSGRQFRNQEMLRKFQEIMASVRFDPRRLCLGISEHALMANLEPTMETLKLFKQMGVLVSIDSFGSGYWSLEYLQKIPADILKIDRSFIQKIDKDIKIRQIIQFMANMASVFGLELAAEGVETAAQQELLCALGCQIHEGFPCSSLLPGDRAAHFAKNFSLLDRA